MIIINADNGNDDNDNDADVIDDTILYRQDVNTHKLFLATREIFIAPDASRVDLWHWK